MITETLTFAVTPKEFAKDFLHVDNMVWTPWLKRQPGFLGKTSSYTKDGVVTLLIKWRSQKDIDALKEKESETKAVEFLMKSQSPGSYRLLNSSFTST